MNANQQIREENILNKMNIVNKGTKAFEQDFREIPTAILPNVNENKFKKKFNNSLRDAYKNVIEIYKIEKSSNTLERNLNFAIGKIPNPKMLKEKQSAFLRKQLPDHLGRSAGMVIAVLELIAMTNPSKRTLNELEEKFSKYEERLSALDKRKEHQHGAITNIIKAIIKHYKNSMNDETKNKLEKIQHIF